MEILKWNETSIEIKPSLDINLYSKNCLSATNESGRVIDKYKISIKGEYIIVDFGIKINTVKIDGKEFIRSKKIVEVKKDELSFELDELINTYETVAPRSITTKNENGIVSIINNTTDDIEVEVEIKSYIKETYPDFAQTKVKKTFICKGFSEVEVAKQETARIIEVIFSDLGLTETIEYSPVYYFTTVVNLKTFLKDTGYLLPTKTDDEYKSKISEKSTYLKRRFGLLPLQLEDYEYYPAYAKLVHLYCLYDYCVYNFLTGDNAGVGEGTGGITGGSVTLGKFSTKEGGTTGTSSGSSSSDSGYIPTMVKDKIKEAEADLEKSIFIKSVSFKTGGVANANRSNISGCFKNR